MATCRHVWQIAVDAAAKAGSTGPMEVEIEYPHSWRADRSTVRDKAILADACETAEGPLPDLVFLKPKSDLPSNVMSLQLATKELFETGNGYAFVGLKGLNESRPNEVRDIRIKGTIDSFPTSDGLHQFTGENAQSYWSKEGSSGSPVFRDGGQQLAGILSLSDLGDKHVALVVPGTTIRRYFVEFTARHVPESKGIDPDTLRPLLEFLREYDVPVSEMPELLKRYAAERRQQEHPGKLTFVHENNTTPGMDYVTNLRNVWRGVGANEAVFLIAKLYDIEKNGPEGITETINGLTLYFADCQGHCIAHTRIPDAQDEIIVVTIFNMRDFQSGRAEAWRLLKKIV